MSRLSGVPLLLVVTYQLATQAKVAPSISTGEEAPSSCVDHCARRTFFKIIWGCVSTTIICAWTSVHPNIPPREGPLKGILRRLELMFWTIVAPEILPCWALNQLLAAMTVRDVYNHGKGHEKKSRGIWETVKRWLSLYDIKEAASQEWTSTHGHFLVMGGFHVVEPPDSKEVMGMQGAATDAVVVPPTSAVVEEANTEKGYGPENKPEAESRVTVLTLEMLRELVKDPEFRIQITQEEITDRSKGDALSKIIFIMQSSWFILQCVGRRIQGLSLTQLELTTLALASLNGITFALWWDKPLGVQSIVRLYVKRKLTDSERQVEGREPLAARSLVIPFLQEFCVARIRVVCQSQGLIRLPLAVLLVLILPVLAFASALIATLADLLGTSTSFSTDDTHVPTFYVPEHRYSARYHVVLLISLGVIFGGIHCSGWNFPFPTYPEQKLWRVASLAVTIIPIAILPFTTIIDSIVTCRPPGAPTLFPGILAFVLSTLAYVSARLVLLGLALALLRHLPPTAFIAINWTNFYPHIL